MEDLNYQMLFLRAREILNKPSDALNDNALCQLLLDARMKGYDGREILAKAWEVDHRTEPALLTPVTFLRTGASIDQEMRAGGFTCRGCKKSFESSTALNGHGEKRCLKKSNL